jgi:hypothetical protein
MVCRCGKTLKLTGARPGRVGRCPACGATFRVPEPGAVATPPPPRPAPRAAPAPPPTPPRAPAADLPNPPRAAPSRPSPAPPSAPAPRRPGASRRREVWEGEDDDFPAGYGLAPEPARRAGPAGSPDAHEVNPVRVAARETGLLPIEPLGRSGFVMMPGKPERSPFVSLLYPIWDVSGLSWMLGLTPFLAIATLCTFGLIPIALRGDEMALFGPFAFAMIPAFILGVGYVLAILADVAVSSAEGQTSHPKWPEINLGTIGVGLLRWAVALGLGCGPLAMGALAYWRGRPEKGPADLVLVALMASAGGLYSLMAMLSIYLHDDLLAVKPSMVLAGAFRVGAGYVLAWLAWVASIVVGVLIVAGIYRIGSLWPTVVAVWGAWVFAIYAGLVVMRLLGLAYHRRIKQVGWFETKHRPKDVPPERTPAPVAEY